MDLMTPRILFFLCLLLAIARSESISQDHRTFINPGVKLGYRFGENGGLAAGFEISATRWTPSGYLGLLLSVDHSGKTLRTHLGFEGGRGLLGLAIGPTIAFRDKTLDYGFNVTPYAGFVIIPYYNFMFLRSFPSEHEVGSFIKFPIQVSGERFRSFGG
jgi:hypothetical protein